jgi:general stress protein 26
MKKKVGLDKIKLLLESQMLGVIATDMDGHPYANLVAFASTKDLKNIIFATSKNTTKYKNIKHNAKTSVLVDNRQNTPSDFEKSVSLTAFGEAKEIIINNTYYKKLYLDKHPKLMSFVNSSDCALIKIQIDRYQYVNKFQNIINLKMK